MRFLKSSEISDYSDYGMITQTTNGQKIEKNLCNRFFEISEIKIYPSQGDILHKQTLKFVEPIAGSRVS